jgi:hypothetical protein
MNSRGQISDVLYALFIVFAFGVVLLLFGYMFGAFNTALKKNPSVNETIMINATSTFQTETIPTIDKLVPLLFIGINIGVIVLCFMVRSNPIFFILIVLLIPVVIFMAALLSDAYNTLASNPHLTEMANELGYTYMVMQNLVLIQLIFAFIDAVVLFSGVSMEQRPTMQGQGG